MQNNVFWKYGVAPFNNELEIKNRQAIISVKNIIESCVIVDELHISDSISWVAGMLNKVLKQNSWDWITVKTYFGNPTDRDLPIIFSALTCLKNAIKKHNKQVQNKAINNLVDYGFVDLCNNYLNFSYEKFRLQEVNQCKVSELNVLPQIDGCTQHISICEVNEDDMNQKFVFRVADINENGLIKPFKVGLKVNPTFNNRLIFPVECETMNKDLIVIEWSYSKNKNSKEECIYLKVRKDIELIEIVKVFDCDTVDRLIEKLKSGLKSNPSARKTIFLIKKSKNDYLGVLCDCNQIIKQDDLILLDNQVEELPLYIIAESQIITSPNRKIYYSTNIDSSNTSLRITDTPKIEEKECMDPDSLSDDDLLSVISTNTALMERCKNLITDDWQEENRQKIDEADRSIQEKTEQIEALSAEMTKIENNIVNLTNAKKRIEQEIHEKEKLAVDVRKNVDIIITKAQEHAAEFMASMAFVNTNGNTPVKVEKGSSSCFTSGTTILSEQVEEYEDWKDLINNLSDNLIEAGVCSKHSESFAAFLYSSYLNHFPLLLSGPNASEIADAFSASLFGKTAGILECVKDYDRSIISAVLASEDEIIKICNPFTSEWISSITRLSTYSGKYCIAVHPFAEDIVIEPKGITHYFYPVLTEMLVSHVPECKFLSVCYSGNYQDYQHITPKGRKAGILKDMHMSMLTYNRINDVIFNLHNMLDDDSIDYDVLYAILPYAYMTMQTDKLLDAVNQKKIAVSKDLSDELNRLFGDE